MLWEEPIVWVGTKETPIHEEGPLPLLLFSQGCVIRARALQALDDCDLRWRNQSVSRRRRDTDWSCQANVKNQ